MSGVGTHRWEALPLLFYRMLSGRGMQATAWANRRPSADIVPQGLPRYGCTRLAGGKHRIILRLSCYGAQCQIPGDWQEPYGFRATRANYTAPNGRYSQWVACAVRFNSILPRAATDYKIGVFPYVFFFGSVLLYSQRRNNVSSGDAPVGGLGNIKTVMVLEAGPTGTDPPSGYP